MRMVFRTFKGKTVTTYNTMIIKQQPNLNK